MTARDFCFWFMGSLELVEPKNGLDETQTQILKNHLNMVFEHIVNDDGTLKDEPKQIQSCEIDILDKLDFEQYTTKINC